MQAPSISDIHVKIETLKNMTMEEIWAIARRASAQDEAQAEKEK